MTLHTFVLDKDTSRSFAAAWRAQAQHRKSSAGDHLLHALLLGKDPLRAFSPVTNAVKLANGQSPRAGLRIALDSLTACSGAGLRAGVTRLAPGLPDDAALVRLAKAAADLQRQLAAEGL